MKKILLFILLILFATFSLAVTYENQYARLGGGGTIVNNYYQLPTLEKDEEIKEEKVVSKGEGEEEQPGNPWKYYTIIPPKESGLKESGLSEITGLVVSGIKSNLSLVGILATICLILSGLVGYFYAKSRKK